MVGETVRFCRLSSFSTGTKSVNLEKEDEEDDEEEEEEFHGIAVIRREQWHLLFSESITAICDARARLSLNAFHQSISGILGFRSPTATVYHSAPTEEIPCARPL